MTLFRRGKTETVAIHELGPRESAPVLKQYIALEGIVRPYFDAGSGSAGGGSASTAASGGPGGLCAGSAIVATLANLAESATIRAISADLVAFWLMPRVPRSVAIWEEMSRRPKL